MEVGNEIKVNSQKPKAHLFLSSPIRNPASASAARKLPSPASFLSLTAYSLIKA